MPFETSQKFAERNVEAAMSAFGGLTKGAQAIVTDASEYARASYEQGRAAFERILGAKSLDKAFEIQADYVKSSYESVVAQANKVAGLYTDLAKTALQPFADLVGQSAAPASKSAK